MKCHGESSTPYDDYNPVINESIDIVRQTDRHDQFIR